MSMGEFAGRGVIITGALGIYGTWIADAFAREGAKLCLTDREHGGLEHRLAAAGGADGSFVQVADVTQDGALAELVKAVGERWGSADILINNAGVYPSGFFAGHPGYGMGPHHGCQRPCAFLADAARS